MGADDSWESTLALFSSTSHQLLYSGPPRYSRPNNQRHEARKIRTTIQTRLPNTEGEREIIKGVVHLSSGTASMTSCIGGGRILTVLIQERTCEWTASNCLIWQLLVVSWGVQPSPPPSGRGRYWQAANSARAFASLACTHKELRWKVLWAGACLLCHYGSHGSSGLPVWT